ncbi:response regulator [Arcobacter sp. LA11]|uniref:response regulator n=1 Tax=Arcobacter sp. LA11 TaxID=1898176 RepID=UPI0009332027|nr:response regulator [Arcobacter sp. LA11]
MNNKNLRILIVDDEPLITMFIKRVIENMGHIVVGICKDGESALSTINKEKPNIVFMDINIKGPLDGISVIKKNSNQDLSVIYVSSYSEQDILDEALSTNPTNYLIKPIKEEDVKIAITLAKQKFQKQNYKPKKNIEKKHLIFSEELYYDYDLKELFLKKTPVALSMTEKKMLDIFIRNKNINLSIDMIRDDTWKDKKVSDSTIRDHISNLRKKNPLLPIQTNFGRGYTLVVN